MKNFTKTALRLVVILAGLQAGDGAIASSTDDVKQWRVVNFWSEWCAPCRDEIPMLNELNDQLALTGADVTIVGVNFEDNPREETLEIARRMGISFPTLSRDAIDQMKLKAPAVLPTTYILSPDDVPVVKLVGAQNRASLMAQLDELQLLDRPGPEVVPIDNPADTNSALSRVVTDEQGAVYLSWVSLQGEMAALWYARLDQDEWQAPQEIARGEDWFVNWADFPSLAVNQSSMVAHWLRMSASGTYDYDVKASFYLPDHQEWSEAITVNNDGVSAEHGFVSMVPMSAGRTFMSWLDGRNTRGDSGQSATVDSHETHGPGGAMTLRASIFDRNGETLQEWELDARVCDCCQTSAALAASGPVVVYRDRSDEEIRDTYITRLVDGHWSAPVAVSHDGWKIAGCPVNGPSVAAKGEFVAVAWFTAVGDSPEVKLALSNDSGATFSAPISVSGENTLGRISSGILASGEIVVSWVAVAGETAYVMLARYSVSGELLDRVPVAQTQASRRSGIPVISSSGNDVYVTWTDVAKDSRIRLARIRF